jgi:hypothetical protein
LLEGLDGFKGDERVATGMTADAAAEGGQAEVLDGAAELAGRDTQKDRALWLGQWGLSHLDQ